MSNDTYCPVAFNQVYADNGGKYRLCCHASPNHTLDHMRVDNTLPFDYLMSDEMEDIRLQMLSGEKIQGCEKCYKLEDDGHKSWRQWKYKADTVRLSEIENVGLKLRINGSYCNLGCYMCHPYNSSTRRAELKATNMETEWQGGGGVDDVVNVKSGRFEEILEHIHEHVAKIGYMNITGGEPILLPRMWAFLDNIPDEYAKNINLTFDTNLTHTTFKGRSIREIVDRFNQVWFGVSCDHYGERLEWIRYPIDVKSFEQNIRDNWDIIKGLNCTVSLLNVFELYEIKEYYATNFNVGVSFNNIVRNPKTLSIKNLPQDDKDMLNIKYKDDPMMSMVISELEKDINQMEYDQGILYCEKLSAHRNTDFIGVFPG